MEFKGIPMGHLYMLDTSTPTMIQKPIKIASYQELDEFMREVSAQHNIDYTDLEDIDDTMDMDLAQIGLVECNIPKIPEGYKPSNEEIKQTIQRAIQASEAYLK